MDEGARSRALVDAFVRHLDAAGPQHLSSRARGLARDLARAYGVASGDARFLALAEVRDTARSLRSDFRRGRKQRGKDYSRARRGSGGYSDGAAYISIYTEREYDLYSVACSHIRGIIRSITRDLAREMAAARAQGVSRVTAVSRRLVELAVRPAVGAPSQRRRRFWSDLDELARGAHPRSAQLCYAVGALLLRLRESVRPGS